MRGPARPSRARLRRPGRALRHPPGRPRRRRAACSRGILGAGTVRVNSLHRQGIGRLADGLAVEATAPDGTIEAVRVIDAPGFAIGVQWHPEYWVESDEPSAKLFAAFGEAIRARMAARADGGDRRGVTAAAADSAQPLSSAVRSPARRRGAARPKSRTAARAADLDSPAAATAPAPSRRPASRIASPLAETASVASAATVSPVPSAMTKVAATPARDQPLRQREDQDDDRARARPDADREDRRPARSRAPAPAT